MDAYIYIQTNGHIHGINMYIYIYIIGANIKREGETEFANRTKLSVRSNCSKLHERNAIVHEEIHSRAFNWSQLRLLWQLLLQLLVCSLRCLYFSYSFQIQNSRKQTLYIHSFFL